MYVMFAYVKLLRVLMGHLNTLSASTSKSVRACRMTKLNNMTILLYVSNSTCLSRIVMLILAHLTFATSLIPEA